MPEIDPAERIKQIEKRFEKAHAMVVALCKPRTSDEHREWVMSIPARPECDPDLVIDASLRDIPWLLSRMKEGEELQQAPVAALQCLVEPSTQTTQGVQLTMGAIVDTATWIISDIEGTLADFTHRLPFIKHPIKPDWDSFNAACMGDSPLPAACGMLRFAKHSGCKIALITAQPEMYRYPRERWLHRHQVPYDLLLMRPTGDHRSDHEVKRDLYNLDLRSKRVLVVLEDRDKVVDMWRGLGLSCFQVQKGAY